MSEGGPSFAGAISRPPAAATGDGADYSRNKSRVSFVHDTMKPTWCQSLREGKNEKKKETKARSRLSRQDSRYIHPLVFNYSLFISPKLLVIVCSRNLIQPAAVNESRNNGRRTEGKKTKKCKKTGQLFLSEIKDRGWGEGGRGLGADLLSDGVIGKSVQQLVWTV